MKKKLETIGIIILLIVLSVRCADGAPGEVRTNITLYWDYPTNELRNVDLFKFYSSTNITTPVTNWPLLITFSGTNTTIHDSNTVSVTLPIDQNQRFYVGTASNWFWGETFFSNVTNPPPPLRHLNNLRLVP